MSTGLPKRIDPQRLAAQGTALNGELSTAAMPRLQAEIADQTPVPVHVKMRAFRDEARRLVLAGRVGAELQGICQRCMEQVTLAIEGEFSLAVVRDEDAARQLPAELDPLLLERDGEVDLAAVVEDELLLALPPIAMHADSRDCGERAQLARQDNESGNGQDEFDGAAKRENPFAVLKKLKQDNPD